MRNFDFEQGIITAERSELLVLTKENYDQYAGESHRKFIENRIAFLRKCQHIESGLQTGQYSLQDLVALANCLTEVSYSGHSIICKEGRPADQIVFVRSGNVSVLKCITVNDDITKKKFEKERKSIAAAEHAIRASILAPLKSDIMSSKNKIGREDSTLSGFGDDDINKTTFGNDAVMSVSLKVLQNTRRQNKIKNKKTSKLFDLDEGGGVTNNSLNSANSSPRMGNAARESKIGGSSKGSPRLPGATSSSLSMAGNRRGSIGRRGSIESTQSGAGNKNSPQSMSEIAKMRRKMQDQERENLAKGFQEFRAGQKIDGFSSLSVKDQLAEYERIQRQKNGEKKIVLHVGKVAAFYFYGEQQVLHNKPYPVTLISDPQAEIYTMSKHDFMRRLPKKLLISFIRKKEHFVWPSDASLYQSMLQTQRWERFKQELTCEAIRDSAKKRTEMAIEKPMRGEGDSRLKVRPKIKPGPRTMRMRLDGTISVDERLSRYDVENYSAVSGMFLQRLNRADKEMVEECLRNGTLSPSPGPSREGSQTHAQGGQTAEKWLADHPRMDLDYREPENPTDFLLTRTLFY